MMNLMCLVNAPDHEVPVLVKNFNIYTINRDIKHAILLLAFTFTINFLKSCMWNLQTVQSNITIYKMS